MCRIIIIVLSLFGFILFLSPEESHAYQVLGPEMGGKARPVVHKAPAVKKPSAKKPAAKRLAAKKVAFKKPVLAISGVLTICSFDYYIKPVEVSRTIGNYFTRDSVRGPATYTHSFSRELSSEVCSELTASTGLSKEIIAAKLGTRYVKKEAFNKSVTLRIPAGDWSIYAFPEFNTYTFEVWKKGFFGDIKIGTYSYKEPTGIGIYHQRTPQEK